MKKLSRVFILTVILMILMSSIVSASGVVANKSIRVTEPFINEVPTVDPIPRLDKGVIDSFTTTSSPRVTASDVGLYKTSYDYYYSKGYVTMKLDNNDFYHYTRAELDVYPWMSIVDDEKWGWGKVSSETEPYHLSGTARIYYGW